MAVGNGWHAPLEAEWLNEAVHTASLTYFDRACAHMGEGGSIPFMGMLLNMFPKAQFLVTGAAGPGSNMCGWPYSSGSGCGAAVNAAEAIAVAEAVAVVRETSM